ncbi:hypothetical protein [Streptomyces sp. NPDC048361]|uniref:hypothetical protein n=1 Tax=Streptomyces sp. NPDC048361 TaxID=3154720 RepID=UPI003439991F
MTIVDACRRQGQGGSPTAVLDDAPFTDAERQRIRHPDPPGRRRRNRAPSAFPCSADTKATRGGQQTNKDGRRRSSETNP